MMRRRTITIFLIIEVILYLVYMTMDLTGSNGSTIGFKYAGILLCLLFSSLCAFYGGDEIVPFALLFTAIADFFLLVINQDYLVGVSFFIVVQSLYLARLYLASKKTWLAARVLCALAVILFLFLAGMASALNLITLIYFTLLFLNMLLSWTLKDKKWRIFSLGLSLFVLCDLCVGAFNMAGALPEGLYAFVSIGMWLFYLPSQVLISLSTLNPEDKSIAPSRS